MWCALAASLLLLQSPIAPPELIFADDFEDSISGSLYGWSSSEPAEYPWWQRQWPIEDCVAYAQRFHDQNLWDACVQCDYWKRSCGTNTGHRCQLWPDRDPPQGSEFLWVIFFTDFDAPHLACWDELVTEPGG